MSRTVHGTSCWECLDFNIKNTMGEECEGNKHIFCDKSLKEHDERIAKETLGKVWKKTISMHDDYVELETLDNYINEIMSEI